MRIERPLTRRWALALLAGAAIVPARALAASHPPVMVHKDPNCGCCGEWVTHLRNAGFTVTTTDTPRMTAVKTRLGVPNDLASCHTAEIGAYVIEGHVPASAITRLLAERPTARGLAVPGMPIGSPGMEGGEPDTYDVVLFGPQGRSVFARFKGGDELKA